MNPIPQTSLSRYPLGPMGNNAFEFALEFFRGCCNMSFLTTMLSSWSLVFCRLSRCGCTCCLLWLEHPFKITEFSFYPPPCTLSFFHSVSFSSPPLFADDQDSPFGSDRVSTFFPCLRSNRKLVRNALEKYCLKARRRWEADVLSLSSHTGDDRI